MRFRGAYITTMCGGDKDCAARVSSLTNEEPLVVVKACVDIVWKVIREDGGDSRYGMVGKGETPLCRGGRGNVREGAFGTKNRDVSRNRGSGVQWGSDIFASRRGDEDIVGVDSDIFMEGGEEEGIEDFLSDLRRGGRHCG